MSQNTEAATLLMVDDTPANLHVLLDYLDDTGYNLVVATSGEQALERCQAQTPDLILLDVMMPGLNGFETCERLKQDEHTQDIPIIFMTALSDPADKIRGFEAGGVDYITKPIEHTEVLARIRTHLRLRQLQRQLQNSNQILEQRVQERTAELQQALEEIRELKQELEHENQALRQELRQTRKYGDIIGASPAIQNVTQKIEMVAPTDASVLILGPSGTGKELVAREIHNRSRRAEAPLVKVNCASIPRELYESEFFGHAKGAFTGAVQSRMGRFAAAHGGTLFLDEIGEIPLDLQSKLLRVLQEGTYERVGEEKTRSVDVRIVAATNRDLKHEVEEGRFRADLYYRLNVFPVEVPPLAQRLDDVPLLAQYFLKRSAPSMGLDYVPRISEAQAEQLRQYHWPGNIRELQNIIEQALIRARFTGKLSFSFLPEASAQAPSLARAVGAGRVSHASAPSFPAAPPSQGILTEDQVRDFERQNLIRALEFTRGRIRGDKGAAKLLGIKPTTLASRIKSMDIPRP